MEYELLNHVFDSGTKTFRNWSGRVASAGWLDKTKLKYFRHLHHMFVMAHGLALLR
jgi:hypothetical protein